MSFPLCWTNDQLKDEICEKFAYTCDLSYIVILQTTSVTLFLPVPAIFLILVDLEYDLCNVIKRKNFVRTSEDLDALF